MIDTGLKESKVIFSDDSIEVTLTGRDYDFIACIENKTDEDLVVSIAEECGIEEPLVIEANDWYGIMANQEGFLTVDYIVKNGLESDSATNKDNMDISDYMSFIDTNWVFGEEENVCIDDTEQELGVEKDTGEEKNDEFMTLDELSPEQVTELKQNYLTEKMDANGESVSYGELADADSLVSMDELKENYGTTRFVKEDFFCSEEEKNKNEKKKNKVL